MKNHQEEVEELNKLIKSKIKGFKVKPLHQDTIDELLSCDKEKFELLKENLLEVLGEMIVVEQYINKGYTVDESFKLAKKSTFKWY